ncbi:MAG: aminotransferase class I/II-fold pyridoxal phosphate-dependent enzyme [Archaeoglobaceae archaeon]|nr:aminotransferase class I/II-fold pyridoxal phosphate-dependent enzyme [Archaeoglobaceae archaeon]MDW7989979.1 aminotransferase class I/II-fold pyridoxal phosphate-dependent enzyme [Archaeoglobaceae archaeon]
MEAQRLRDVSTSLIRKMFEIVERARKEGKDIVSLTIGEPDFATPNEVVERAIKAINSGYTHYTSNLGIEELRTVIAERYGVSKDNVMITAGGSEALLNASLAFIEESSKVVIPSPSFLSYFTYAKICKAKITEMKTHDSAFVPDVDLFSEWMSRDVSVVFLNYPNNPTGAVIDERSARAIAEIAMDYNTVIISDEIYDKIYYDRKPTTLADYENVVVVNGFSKSLAMTGWRIGYVVAREDLLNSMLKIHQVNGVCAPAFAQKAVAEVMLNGEFEKIVSRMVLEFRKRRDYIYGELSKLYSTIKPEGAFYMFLNVQENCLEFAEKLIDYGVAVTPGIAFGSGNERFIRISYANSMENLKKAVERIKNFYDSKTT